MRLIEATFGDKNYILSPPESIIEETTEPYITILIGANASGKSRCLSKITEAFRKSHDARTGKKLDTEYTLKFQNESMIREIDSRNSYDVHESSLPSSVISISNSIADKFPLKAKISDANFYEYIGARDNGLDQERFAIYSLVDTLQEIGSNELMVEKTKEVFEFLSLDPKVWISLKTNRRSDSKVYNMLFHDNWVEDQFVDELLNSSRFGRLSASHKSKITIDLRDQNYMRGLKEFILTNRNSIDNDEKGVNAFMLNFNQPESLRDFERNYKYFTLLRKLNVLTYDKIEVKKSNDPLKYNLMDSSSGEVCLLTTFVRTLPHLKNNSLILIDEPEISLHPNWQIQYIDKLRKLLNGVFNSHVIIATHSPYLVSNVNPKNGCVIKIENSINYQKTSVLPSNPYGWSVEDILYNVFNVGTYRNFNLEMDVRSLIDLVSKKANDKNKIIQLIEKLDRFEFSDDDPLNIIINDAKKYLDKI